MFTSLESSLRRASLVLLVACLALPQSIIADDTFPITLKDAAMPPGHAIADATSWEELKRIKLGDEYQPESVDANAPEPDVAPAPKANAATGKPEPRITPAAKANPNTGKAAPALPRPTPSVKSPALGRYAACTSKVFQPVPSR